MGFKRLILLAAAISLLALWGCSSSMDSGSDSGGEGGGTPAETLQAQIDAAGLYVGPARCIDCHLGFSWSADDVNTYLGIGEPAPVDDEEDTRDPHVFNHVTQAAPEEYADIFPGVDCLDCHDRLGDGQLLEGYLNAADVPAEGLTAVTCEVCHGSGIDHYGVGPIPYPTPGPERCGQCHDRQWETVFPEHEAFHPEGNAIYSDWDGSPHHAEDEHDLRNEAPCVKCHNDEGARAYKDIHTSAQLLASALPIDGEVSPIQCRTCHNAHNPKELLHGESEIVLQASGDEYDASAEYSTCTNCHQPADAQLVPLTYQAGDARGTEGDTKTYEDWLDDMEALAAEGITDDQPQGDLIYHGARFERVISSTHWDNPLTNDEDDNELIEGYVVNPESDRSCRDCHNVHSADITINRQWGHSGHGGNILDAKEAVDADDHSLAGAVEIRLAGSHSAWSHHVWSVDEEAECQRCHSATGAKNFLSGPTAYYTAMDAFIEAEDSDPNQTAVASPNDFSYLKDGQCELLYCWACHTNNVGAMRNPGSVTLEDRDFNKYGPVPDIGKSNVCVGCHGGRANGEYIRNTLAVDRTTSGRVHHLPAAGALFAAVTHTGYEFTGQDYESDDLLHDTIGRNLDSPESGEGPCAGCHMPNADHHFEVEGMYVNDLVTTDGSAVVTSASATFVTHGLTAGDTFTLTNGDDKGDYLINSVQSETQLTLDSVMTDDATGIEAVAPEAIANQALCNTCHDGTPLVMNYTVLETISDEFEDAVLYFHDLAYNVVTNYADHTFNSSSWLQGRGDTESGKNDYGALQNYKFVSSDDGTWGYAHNSDYLRRIIFDSLDWLQHGAITGTITIPHGTHPDAISWLEADPGQDTVTRP